MRSRARAFSLVIDGVDNLRPPHGPCPPSTPQLSTQPRNYASALLLPVGGLSRWWAAPAVRGKGPITRGKGTIFVDGGVRICWDGLPPGRKKAGGRGWCGGVGWVA